MKDDNLKNVKFKHYIYAIIFEVIALTFGMWVYEELEGSDKEKIALLAVAVFFLLVLAIPISIVIKKLDKYL